MRSGTLSGGSLRLITWPARIPNNLLLKVADSQKVGTLPIWAEIVNLIKILHFQGRCHQGASAFLSVIELIEVLRAYQKEY